MQRILIKKRGVIIKKLVRLATHPPPVLKSSSDRAQTFSLFLYEAYSFCGAGGIRTRVQTRNQQAFYMLSPNLIAGIQLA